ncbi:MAG: ABC transporter ATP-binding protein [Actinobacteria bacterium]|nr:ABC transporter ATP-binding protein [Actinomycetota bacterium]
MSRELLRVSGLTKRFGTFYAVNDVSFEVAEGSIHSIIGPNGAGKTTLFRLLTGVHAPTSGSVVFEDEPIAGKRPYTIARKGLVQSFQMTSIFPRLTALESIAAAIVTRSGRSADLFSRFHRAVESEARELLESVGLGAEAETEARTLSHGDQRALDIALALATHPKLLLLDEPTSGMSPAETRKTTELVVELARSSGLTVLFSEHDMDVVFEISERVTVLHQGRVIAEGTVAEVQSNPEVMAVYLGEEPALEAVAT